MHRLRSEHLILINVKRWHLSNTILSCFPFYPYMMNLSQTWFKYNFFCKTFLDSKLSWNLLIELVPCCYLIHWRYSETKKEILNIKFLLNLQYQILVTCIKLKVLIAVGLKNNFQWYFIIFFSDFCILSALYVPFNTKLNAKIMHPCRKKSIKKN